MTKSRRGKYTRGHSLRRSVGIRALRRTFLVYCEGERTETDYLGALKREPAVRDVASVDIQIHQDTLGSAPLTLVKAAAEARERANQEGSEIDEVWCIFDVEQPKNHPHLKEAIALARDKNVKIAVSNPCFELWLTVHFRDRTAPISTKDAIGLRQRLDKSRDKGVEGATYMPLRDEAARRARELDDRHKGNGTEFPKNNPSSGMYRFLEAVEGS